MTIPGQGGCIPRANGEPQRVVGEPVGVGGCRGRSSADPVTVDLAGHTARAWPLRVPQHSR